MEAERKKILEMLSEGKITVEDAERLLQKLRSVQPEEGSPGEERTGKNQKVLAAIGAACSSGDGPAPRWLRIQVDGGKDKVNIRVPIALIRTGIMLTTMLPEGACTKLSERGIDLSDLGKLSGNELVKALRELQVNVDSEDGEKVRIFCE